MINQLTPDQLEIAKDELGVIKAIHQVAAEHHARIKELPEDSPQTLAELLVVSAAQDIAGERLDKLAEVLGLDDEDLASPDKFAAMLAMIDGNRRTRFALGDSR